MAASASFVPSKAQEDLNSSSGSDDSRSSGEIVVSAEEIYKSISDFKAELNYVEANKAIKLFLDHNTIPCTVVNESSIEELEDILARLEKIKQDSHAIEAIELSSEVENLTSFINDYRSMIECAQSTSHAIIPQLKSNIESAELTREGIDPIRNNFALLRNFEFLKDETNEVRALAETFFAQAEIAIAEQDEADRKNASLQQIFQLADVFNSLVDDPNQDEIEKAKASVKNVLEVAISVGLLNEVDLEELLVLSSDEEESDAADTSFMVAAFSTIKDGVIQFLEDNDFNVENTDGIMAITQRGEEEVFRETESVELSPNGFGNDAVETSDDRNIDFSEILSELANLENNLLRLTGNADFAGTVARYVNGNASAFLPAVKIAVSSKEDLFNYVREQLNITEELLVTDDNVEQIIEQVANFMIANATS